MLDVVFYLRHNLASRTGLKNRDRPAAELQDGVRAGHTTEWPLNKKGKLRSYHYIEKLCDLFLPCLNAKQQVKRLFKKRTIEYVIKREREKPGRSLCMH